MMDCKRALQDAEGDLEAAKQLLRERGMASASKRAGNETPEGIVLTRLDDSKGTIVAVGSETEPVSKNEEFRAFAERVLDAVEKDGPHAVEGLEDDRKELIGKIGENIIVRGASRFESGERRGDRRLRPSAGQQDRRPRQGGGLTRGRPPARDAHRVRRAALRDSGRRPRR